MPTIRENNKKSDKKLRVAAYCRVSTGSNEQLVSYTNQVMYYENYIKARPDYEMAGIFADEGISGTDIRKRDAFNRLMEAARDGQIDLIITKSLSRFGRNTLECLKNIRELKTLGVDVFFEKENIHTLQSKGEMLLTLISAVAQNESLNLSENVKWGIRRQYERGHVQSIPSGKFLGYKKDRQGNLVIDEEQAKVVQRIYQAFLGGLGTYQIAKMLTHENVPMAYGGKEWCASHIYRVLTNEKYQGDTKFQKTFNTDYLTKRRAKNKGQLPQYYVKDTHPAIIDRETWSLVQMEFARQKQFVQTHSMNYFHHQSEDIPFSGKLICSQCSRTFSLRKTYREVSDNEKYWICHAALPQVKKCDNNLKLSDGLAEKAFVTAWNELVSSRAALHIAWQHDPSEENKLTAYRQANLAELLEGHGHLHTFSYELMLKVLDHITVHDGFLSVIFLAGYEVGFDLPKPPMPHPRWTHTRKQKSILALRRMEMGFTQAQLAEKAGISRKHFNRVENGCVVPSLEIAQRLSDILGLTLKF